MNLSPEDRTIGKENFCAAAGSGLVRRDFLTGQIQAGLASKKGLGAYYFGYGESVPSPVRVGILGIGDQGSVLAGAINPAYVEVKSIADIRPYNVWRALHGDHYSETARRVRPGLKAVYGWTDAQAEENLKIYGDYRELIANAQEDGIEAVIIALPLHLHAPAAVAAARAGLHVLTEKLMGHSVYECKEMSRAAQQAGRHLATGHQRHYNIIYDAAVDMIRKGVLGDLHYIRAQWHRGNLPGNDSWQQPMPPEIKPDDPLSGRLGRDLASRRNALAEEEKKTAPDVKRIEQLRTLVAQIEAQLADAVLAKTAADFGYEDKYLTGLDGKPAMGPGGKPLYFRPAAEELIRWRLWERTGGGLMAELGSHQLDAASIFIAAAHGGEKQYPLSVVAAANRPLFPLDREVEDHVYCLFDYPAPGYDAADPIARQRKIGVMYASVNGNGFGGYGETVLGTQGTLLLERELDPLLFQGAATQRKIQVGKGRDGKLTLPESADGDEASAAIARTAILEAERGYAEQIEHWAWCIRENPEAEADGARPRCHPKVALGDAVIALVSNMAARDGRRVDFKKEWFDFESDETPEGVKPDLGRYST